MIVCGFSWSWKTRVPLLCRSLETDNYLHMGTVYTLSATIISKAATALTEAEPERQRTIKCNTHFKLIEHDKMRGGREMWMMVELLLL